MLDVDEPVLWRVLSVRAHTVLGDYAGIFVAWRPDGMHVSAPASEVVDVEARMRGNDAQTLRTAALWQALARWCARDSNVASLATARGLGFAAHCTQLALRPERTAPGTT